LGFGRLTGIDLKGEVTGILPSTDWKRKAYRRPEQKRWFAGETISLGIGQGYNSFTMLQIATALGTVATNGQRFEPRLVNHIENVLTRERRSTDRVALPPVPYKPEHTAFIREAMYGVTQQGTGTRVFMGAGYASGGKTGTAQAVGLRQNEKYVASRMDEYRRDHSLYEAFAPLDEPRVAMAVIVENAGFGAAAAAPIARRVLDYLLLGVYPSEEDILAVQQGKATSPIGTPRRAADVPLPKGMDAFGDDVSGVTADAALASPPSVAAPRAASAASVPVVAASAPLPAGSAPTPAAPKPSMPAAPASIPAVVRPAASRETP
jgi:penicillin-binding protein 2